MIQKARSCFHRIYEEKVILCTKHSMSAGTNGQAKGYLRGKQAVIKSTEP